MDKKVKTHQDCFVIYGAFIASMILQFFWATMWIGLGLMIVVAVIASQKYKDKTLDEVVLSHYHWIVRSFWIGSGVYIPIIVVLTIGLVFKYVDLSALTSLIYSGKIMNEADMMRAVSGIIEAHQIVFSVIFLGLWLPFAIWWFGRLIKGLILLKKNKKIEKSITWFI